MTPNVSWRCESRARSGCGRERLLAMRLSMAVVTLMSMARPGSGSAPLALRGALTKIKIIINRRQGLLVEPGLETSS